MVLWTFFCWWLAFFCSNIDGFFKCLSLNHDFKCLSLCLLILPNEGWKLHFSTMKTENPPSLLHIQFIFTNHMRISVFRLMPLSLRDIHRKYVEIWKFLQSWWDCCQILHNAAVSHIPGIVGQPINIIWNQIGHQEHHNSHEYAVSRIYHL